MSAHERRGRLTHRRWPRTAGGWQVTCPARRAISQLKSTSSGARPSPRPGPAIHASQARHGAAASEVLRTCPAGRSCAAHAVIPAS